MLTQQESKHETYSPPGCNQGLCINCKPLYDAIVCYRKGGMG